MPINKLFGSLIGHSLGVEQFFFASKCIFNIYIATK